MKLATRDCPLTGESRKEAVQYFECGIFKAALEDSQRHDRLHDQETPITQSLLASQVLNNNVRHLKTLGVAKCKLFVYKTNHSVTSVC